jgi:hypothetical protein
MKKIRSLTFFFKNFGLGRKFWLLWLQKLSAVLQTCRQIIADFCHLLDQTSLERPFKGPNPPIYTLVKPLKGLINQTKWSIYQTWHLNWLSANPPQEAFLWI